MSEVLWAKPAQSCESTTSPGVFPIFIYSIFPEPRVGSRGTPSSNKARLHSFTSFTLCSLNHWPWLYSPLLSLFPVASTPAPGLGHFQHPDFWTPLILPYLQFPLAPCVILYWLILGSISAGPAWFPGTLHGLRKSETLSLISWNPSANAWSWHSPGTLRGSPGTLDFQGARQGVQAEGRPASQCVPPLSYLPPLPTPVLPPFTYQPQCHPWPKELRAVNSKSMRNKNPDGKRLAYVIINLYPLGLRHFSSDAFNTSKLPNHFQQLGVTFSCQK